MVPLGKTKREGREKENIDTTTPPTLPCFMPQQRRWGQKTAWAKQFFSLQNDSLTSSSSSCSSSTTAKQAKKMELDPDTRWCCRRCQDRFTLPRDPTTGRPMVVLLAQHLEHTGTRTGATASGNTKEDAKGDRDNVSAATVSWCAAGPIYFEEAAAAPAQTGEGGGEASPQPNGRFHQTKASLSVTEGGCRLKALLKACMASREADTAHPYVFVVVENPKTPANLGSILRAMGCLCRRATGKADASADGHGDGSEAPQTRLANDNSRMGGFLYTGTRLDKACAFQAQQLASSSRPPQEHANGGGDACTPVGSTDAQQASQYTPQIKLNSLDVLFEVLAELSADDGNDANTGSVLYRTVAVDLIRGAALLPTYTHPFALSVTPHAKGVTPSLPASRNTCASFVFYLFGPEDGSLSPSVLSQCDEAVYMPTVGSLNLAASVNVLLYDRVAKDCVTLEAERQRSRDSQEGEEPMEKHRKRERERTSADDDTYFAHRNANNHLTWEKH